MRYGVIGTIMFSLAVILVMIIACTATVNSNETCVVTTWGELKGITGPGWRVKPLWDTYTCYPKQGLPYETSEHPETSTATFKDFVVESQTSDGQRVKASYTVVSHVDPAQASNVYLSVGSSFTDVVERVVKVSSRSLVRQHLQNYTATQLYGPSGTLQFQDAVLEPLTTELSSRYVILDDFVVRQVSFTDEYADAVEAKQIAEINIQKQRNDALAAEQTAQRLRNEAQGEADAAFILAQGEAKSLEVVAAALARNPSLIQYEMVKRLNNVNWGFLPSGSLPLFQVPGGATP